MLAVFVVPAINVKRYRDSVSRALGRTLGREVAVRSVSLRILPPGLILKGVVIGDDRTISAEPMLRAEEVRASLRWTSLWRGRLEIASLSFRYPSLNLVRGRDGRWNVLALVERARQIPSAPTTKSRPEARPRFPYIESVNGRVNLKIGNDKKVFAITDADFAVWQPSEGEWRMRLKARPIRTDASLGDTGTVQLNGSIRRAAALRDMPLSLQFSWDHAQLGQLTTLIYGRDRGWRGALHYNLAVAGTPGQLRLTADASIDDFRRYDIVTADSLRLAAYCAAQYSLETRQLSDIACQGPALDGVITARGNVNLAATPTYDLTFTAEHVPLSFALVMARHMKADMPSDLAGVGTIGAVLTCRTPQDGGMAVWGGSGTTSRLSLRSSVVSRGLNFGPVEFDLLPASAQQAGDWRKTFPQGTLRGVPLAHPTLLRMRPFSIDLGGASPANVGWWFSRDWYMGEVAGAAELQRLFQIARTLALPAPVQQVEGDARIQVQLAGRWAGFARPLITGKAQLHGVTAEINGFAAPAQIASATAVASEKNITLQNLTFAFPGTRGNLSGSIQWPRGCTPSAQTPCSLGFTLAADQLSLEDLNRLINPRLHDHPWYAVWTRFGAHSKSPWQELYAAGRISAGKFSLSGLPLSHVSAQLRLAPGKFDLSDLRADVLGGKYVGELRADLTGAAPGYSSAGEMQHISLAEMSSLMHDAWASGTASFSYKGTAAGRTKKELAASAAATAKFQWEQGALPRIILDRNGSPLQIRHFTGSLELAKGIFQMGPSKLETPAGIYEVSGTASLGQDLDLRLALNGRKPPEELRGYSIGGSLAKPRVSPLPVREAQAKATGR